MFYIRVIVGVVIIYTNTTMTVTTIVKQTEISLAYLKHSVPKVC